MSYRDYAGRCLGTVYRCAGMKGRSAFGLLSRIDVEIGKFRSELRGYLSPLPGPSQYFPFDRVAVVDLLPLAPSPWRPVFISRLRSPR